MTTSSKECTIRDRASGATFDVIKEGCGASIIVTNLMSENAYQRERVNWSYRSFQFNKDQTAADMTLDCEVSFCLERDRKNGDCLPYAHECPSGYKKPVYK